MSDDVETRARKAIETAGLAAQKGDFEAAWAAMEHLRPELTTQPVVALAWLSVLRADPKGRARDADLAAILEAWPAEPIVVLLASSVLLARIDGRAADEAVPSDDPSHLVAAATRRCLERLPAEDQKDPEVAGRLGLQLGSALRYAGPQHDAEAEAVYKRVLALRPEEPWWQFDLALFYKNRGRFAEALPIFQDVQKRVGDEPPVLWNVAIAATALRLGDVALETWRKLGFDGVVGADGLPRIQGLADVKVRLSTRELDGTPAHPDEAGKPVRYEDVWVRPYSLVHGVVLNPPRPGLRAGYDDTILWDGQPLSTFDHRGETIHLFPMLARLERGAARAFAFVADASTDVEALNDALPDSVWFYVRPVAPPLEGALIVEPESTVEEASRLVLAALAEAKVRVALADLRAAVGDEAGAARDRALAVELARP